jgi:hypothetical protein
MTADDLLLLGLVLAAAIVTAAYRTIREEVSNAWARCPK